MTHADQKMAAIREREQQIKDQLADPTLDKIEVPTTFFAAQLGLSEALVGPDGRIWVCRGDSLECVFNRSWLNARD